MSQSVVEFKDYTKLGMLDNLKNPKPGIPIPEDPSSEESGQSGRERLEKQQFKNTIGAKFGKFFAKQMSSAQRAQFDIRERFKHKRVFTSRGMIQYKGIVE